MAVDLPEAHAAALNTTRAFVVGIGPEQWANPTPCADWDVRALVNHIVTGNFWAAELGVGKTIEEVGDRLDGDVLGEYPVGEYLVSAELAASVFRAPGAMERPCAVSYGPVPGEIYCGHRFLDVLIHGWDVAKATGQDATLPPDLVEACIEVVTPQAELLAASGMFDTDVEAGESPDPQTRLLAMLGRRP
ncbi:MAG: TIGR03086 family metal-binding protein [Acidimicrobiia bacterium]